LKNIDDEFCKDCWQLIPQLPESYLDRKECYEENCITEEEFDVVTTIQEQKDIDTLEHLVKKYPEKAMEQLNYNQMLRYILGHKCIEVDLENAKAKLIGVSADTL